MTGWERKPIGEICEVIPGQSPEGKFYNEEGKGFPFYQGKKDFGEKYIRDPRVWTTFATKIACAGDILMSVRAPVGPINFTNEKICIGRGLAAIRVSSQIDREFLFYFLLAYQPQIKGNEGAVFASINKNQIESISIPLPPLPEQRRIVALLDEAFAGLETLRANAEKNVQNARELFESYFESIFSETSYKWIETTFSDRNLLQIIDGDRGANYPKSSDFHDEGHCLFLNTKNVRPDGFDFQSRMFVSAEKDVALRKGKLSREDVVLTTRGTIGNVAHYSHDVPFDNVRINSGMVILRPNTERLLSSYLFGFMRSQVLKRQILAGFTGAAQPQLPINVLNNFKLLAPKNIANQAVIVQKLKKFEVETSHLSSLSRNKLKSIDELKQSILHQAFSGQLTKSAGVAA